MSRAKKTPVRHGNNRYHRYIAIISNVNTSVLANPAVDKKTAPLVRGPIHNPIIIILITLSHIQETCTRNCAFNLLSCAGFFPGTQLNLWHRIAQVAQACTKICMNLYQNLTYEICVHFLYKFPVHHKFLERVKSSQVIFNVSWILLDAHTGWAKK